MSLPASSGQNERVGRGSVCDRLRAPLTQRGRRSADGAARRPYHHGYFVLSNYKPWTGK